MISGLGSPIISEQLQVICFEKTMFFALNVQRSEMSVKKSLNLFDKKRRDQLVLITPHLKSEKNTSYIKMFEFLN